MRQLFLIAILTLFSFGAFARAVYVDNKEICESTKGNWRLFNNECANSCDNKFDALLCAANSSFACDCGINRCWDGKKCVSVKIAKIAFDKKTQEAKEKRLAELKELEEKTLAFNQAYQNYVQNQAKDQTQISGQNSTQESQGVLAVTSPSNAAATNLSTTIPPTDAAPAPILDPETIRKNEEQKQICEKQSGAWQEFKNGCADNCGSKIAKISMCTMSLTMGCKCGGSKCWDALNGSCIELEEYKTSLKSTTSNIKPSNSLPPMPNLDIGSNKAIGQSLTK